MLVAFCKDGQHTHWGKWVAGTIGGAAGTGGSHAGQLGCVALLHSRPLKNTFTVALVVVTRLYKPCRQFGMAEAAR